MNIELFPCSGGFAEGFRRSGITFDIAIEKDTDACNSYEKNHGHRPLQMDANDFASLVRSGWRPSEQIEFFLADPPCTPHSRAGKRLGLADERDCMVVTAELIALLRPRAYLIGNVPGLQDSTSWHIVQKVIGPLAKHGYCVADYACLDAADYGVPQHRVRPFWFGHIDGPCIRWPAPTHAAASGQLAIGGEALAPWVTCRQSLQHLSLEELGRPVRMKIRDKGEDGTKHGGDITRCSAPDKVATTVMARQHRKGGQIMIVGAEPAPPAGKKRWLPNGGDESLCSAPDKPASTVGAHEGIKGGQVLLVNDKHPMSRVDEPAMTVTAHLGATGAAQGGAAMELEWPWDRPSTTVFAEDRIMAPGHHDGSNLSSPNAVVLSERAAAILQGFPEGWTFAGATKRARWSQIGQAMPPPLAHAVAESVAEQMISTRAATSGATSAREAG